MSTTSSNRFRIVATSAGLLFVVALILMLARNVADDAYSVTGFTVSVVGAVVVIMLLGSLYEWIVHRHLYHGRSRISFLNNIYVIHSQGHHWHRFPPDRYVEEGPVERIPVHPAEPFEVCHTRLPPFLGVGGAVFSVPGCRDSFRFSARLADHEERALHGGRGSNWPRRVLPVHSGSRRKPLPRRPEDGAVGVVPLPESPPLHSSHRQRGEHQLLVAVV